MWPLALHCWTSSRTAASNASASAGDMYSRLRLLYEWRDATYSSSDCWNVTGATDCSPACSNRPRPQAYMAWAEGAWALLPMLCCDWDGRWISYRPGKDER